MRIPGFLFTAALVMLLSAPTMAQTAISYQGQLQDAEGPFDGTPGMEFRLYDSPEDGNQVGNTKTFPAIEVTDGLFQVELDFGDVFDASPLYLEVEVAGNILTPRQPVTAAPTAVSALNLSSAGVAELDDRYWKQGGNAGTTPGSDFIGTSDNTPLELHVDGNRALRIEPGNGPSVIAGSAANQVTDGAVGAMIAGGNSSEGNRVSDDFGTVAGGADNRAGSDDGDASSDRWAAVGGGQENTASGPRAVVGGGHRNEASGLNSTVGGGNSNTASTSYSTVAGGNRSTAAGFYSTVGGGAHNSVQARFGVIGGGGWTDSDDRPNTSNVVHDEYGTVAGGGNNQAGSDDGNVSSDSYATVGGGGDNTANFRGSTVGGGQDNSASGAYNTVSGGRGNTAFSSDSTVGGGNSNTARFRGTVSGGLGNTASGDRSTVGGGRDNTASGDSAVVPGGRDNQAAGDYSFAAGRNAEASLDGQVVFTDSNLGQPIANTENRFYGNFDNGYRLETDADISAGVFMQNGDSSWTSLISRRHRTDFEPLDAQAVLDAVVDLEVSRWSYKWQTDIDRIGPMAGDFYQAFRIGRDDEGIQTQDAIGVLYAAVQGLAERVDGAQPVAVDKLQEELESEQARNDRLEERVAELDAESERNAELEARLTALEAMLLEERRVAEER